MKNKTTTTITGTSHFSNESAAIRYYSAYGYSRQAVRSKIDSGEIQIGEPKTKKGETASLHPKEGRFFLTSPSL